MQKLRMVEFCISAIWLVGCSARTSTIAPYASQTETRAFSPTMLETRAKSTPDMSTPTERATPILPTLTPGVLLTNAPTANLSTQCIEILSSWPDDMHVNGVIVMGAEDRTVYLLDPNTGEKTLLPQRAEGFTFADLHVSPDRRWLAYRTSNIKLNTSELVITAPDGQPQKIISWEKSWIMISGWLDHERLLISRERESGYPDVYDSLVVVNPFTGQQQELLPEYSNIGYWYPHPNWAWFYRSNTIYDPTLSRVVYPGISEAGSDLLYLWDLQTKREIAAVTGTVSLGVTPKWSPDGQSVLIVGPSTLLPLKSEAKLTTGNDELYSVSLNGKVNRLTYLTNHYTYIKVRSFSFSADGRYVAYWFYAEPATYPDYPDADPQSKSHLRLAILDMTTQEVTDYCLPGFPGGAPLWSPDGHYILAKDEDKALSPNPSKSHVYLVNIEQGFAVQIADIATPYGWLATSP